eukprot:1141440-Pelagomonas_calceolata.AAC.1
MLTRVAHTYRTADINFTHAECHQQHSNSCSSAGFACLLDEGCTKDLRRPNHHFPFLFVSNMRTNP